MTDEKFIVKVIRKRGTEVDQIYEQEFDRIDIGKFAVDLNRKDDKEKDDKSLKMDESQGDHRSPGPAPK